MIRAILQATRVGGREMEPHIMPIRVILADDHQIVRESFRALLSAEPDVTVIADVEDGEAAVKTALALKPDVIVMDMTMPNLNGIEATRQIKSSLPGVKIIALSMHTHHRLVRSMLDAGAAAYILKTCKASELIKALRIVMKGDTYVSPDIKIAPTGTSGPASTPPLTSLAFLSDRERQVLALIADGHETEAIAKKLKMAEKTVASHRRNLMGKLKINTIAELTKFAIREGLISF